MPWRALALQTQFKRSSPLEVAKGTVKIDETLRVKEKQARWLSSPAAKQALETRPKLLGTNSAHLPYSL